MEVKATNTKQKFNCTTKDKIMDNGNCYQLITRKFIDGWSENTPVISEKEFNRLKSLGALSEPYEVQRIIKVTMYDFIKE